MFLRVRLNVERWGVAKVRLRCRAIVLALCDCPLQYFYCGSQHLANCLRCVFSFLIFSISRWFMWFCIVVKKLSIQFSYQNYRQNTAASWNSIWLSIEIPFNWRFLFPYLTLHMSIHGTFLLWEVCFDQGLTFADFYDDKFFLLNCVCWS